MFGMIVDVGLKFFWAISTSKENKILVFNP